LTELSLLFSRGRYYTSAELPDPNTGEAETRNKQMHKITRPSILNTIKKKSMKVMKINKRTHIQVLIKKECKKLE